MTSLMTSVRGQRVRYTKQRVHHHLGYILDIFHEKNQNFKVVLYKSLKGHDVKKSSRGHEVKKSPEAFFYFCRMQRVMRFPMIYRGKWGKVSHLFSWLHGGETMKIELFINLDLNVRSFANKFTAKLKTHNFHKTP